MNGLDLVTLKSHTLRHQTLAKLLCQIGYSHWEEFSILSTGTIPPLGGTSSRRTIRENSIGTRFMPPCGKRSLTAASASAPAGSAVALPSGTARILSALRAAATGAASAAGIS
jgi:hypothetical protein